MVLPLLIMALSSSRTEKKVTLRFISPSFVLQDGQATLFSSKIFEGKADRTALSDGASLELAVGTNSHLPAVEIHGGGTAVVEFSSPGEFTAILSNIRLLRVSDGKRFHVPAFALWRLRVTQQNLANGEADVPLSSHIFRVRVVDPGGEAAADKEVSLQLLAGLQLVQARTDEQGEFFMLGRPDDYIIKLLPGQGEGLRLDIASE